VCRSAIAVLCLVAAAATGCGSASAPYPPTGVDELVIPTPSPDPDDFVDLVDLVDEVTNAWLPLGAVTAWEYDDRSAVSVLGTERRGGLPVVEVARTGPGGRVRTTDLFAQDRAGNVWWVGRDDELFAAAGLAMPAEPRLGDGFVMAEAPGVDVRAEVVATGARVSSAAGEWDDAVVLEVRDGVTGEVRRDHYAPGVGLVRSEPVDGQGTPTGLVEYTSPAG